MAIEAGEGKTLESGYYLILDTTQNLPETDAYNSALLQVTGQTIEITQKYSVPTADKKITAVTSPDGDGTTTAESVNDDIENDSATAEIGDVITYQLITKLPNNLGDYDTYNLKLEDTLDKGLTFQRVSSIKIGNTDVTENKTNVAESGKYVQSLQDVSDSNGKHKLTIEWSDIKSAAGAAADADVVVTYTAILNEKAITGTRGNENTFTVTYSNNPNGKGTGTSVPDETKVYTFKLAVHKEDQDGEALAGAGFVVKNNSNNTYYKYDTDTNTVQWVNSIDDATEYTSQETTGNLNGDFKGLAVGNYTLHEKTTPNGYTTAADIKFTIEATGVSPGDSINLTSPLGGNEGEDNVVYHDKDGDLGVTVVNNSGHVLPSTGGIGTTIFYLAGGILVIGAAALLITKKKRNA